MVYFGYATVTWGWVEKDAIEYSRCLMLLFGSVIFGLTVFVMIAAEGEILAWMNSVFILGQRFRGKLRKIEFKVGKVN